MSWEYEDLFNARVMGDGSFIEEPSFIRVGSMGYRRRTTVSGPRIDAEVFPVFGRDAMGTLRWEKKNPTREAQQRANERRSALRLIQLVEANFTEEDVTIGLSYDNGNVPEDPGRIKKDITNFLDRVRRARRSKGLPPLKYICAIGGDEMPARGYSGKRPHAHLIMSGGMERDELEAIWGKGYANTHRLQPRDEGLGGIAVYFTKQKQDRAPRKGAKAADSISKAIETTVRTQRDLHKLPTLDQDMRKKEFSFRKKESGEKAKLEREKWEAEQKRRAEGLSGDGGVVWETTEPEGEALDG